MYSISGVMIGTQIREHLGVVTLLDPAGTYGRQADGCRSWRPDRSRPEQSYLKDRRIRLGRRIGGGAGAANISSVSSCEISRIGTRMSGARAFDIDLARVGQRRGSPPHPRGRLRRGIFRWHSF